LKVRTFEPGGLAGVSGAAVLDLDLAAGLRAHVAAANVKLTDGRVFGDARTVREWCQSTGALAGVNGGFFGLTQRERKEVIGLLAIDGAVASAGRMVRSPTNRSRRFVRSVLGFDSEGMPHIGWAVGQRGRAGILTEYLTPLNPTRQRFWTVDSAVACGPRLIQNGRIAVTDRQERLVNPPPLRRTFAGYNVMSGKPRFLVLGIAESMTFQNVAGFLDRYFRKYHETPCAEAMCLDGGASSQLAYRAKGALEDISETDVTVPSAVLVSRR
jgi:hypothetical protein